MKTLLALLLFLLMAPGGTQELDRFVPADPNHSNSFTQSNPGYRVRAGGFYEESYLQEATNALCSECGIDDSQEKLVRALLRGYIYRWLDAYVESGGQRSELTLEEEQWLDEQVVLELGSESVDGYLRWKTSAENTLGFLFSSPRR